MFHNTHLYLNSIGIHNASSSQISFGLNRAYHAVGSPFKRNTLYVTYPVNLSPSTVSASKTNASSKASSTKKNGTAKANKEDKTTKKASSTKKAETTKKNEATTDKKETTTKETTTEKPEKREVIVRVQLPNSSDLKQAKLTIKYKTEKDKEYKTLKIDDPNDKKNQLDYEVVKLDGKTVKKYSLGKIKGDVKVKVSISGVELTGNTATIKSNENSVTIAPASGIDIAIGKKD